MEKFLSFLTCLTLGCFSYRIRGGGWLILKSNTLCRLVWGILGLSIPYIILMINQAAPFDIPHLVYCLALIPLAFGAMMIPHAFAQNMGTFGRPWTLGSNNEIEPKSKYWPGLVAAWPCFPETQEEWDRSSMTLKAYYDFIGMLASGFFQGAIVFGLPMLIVWTLFNVDIDYERFLRAWCVITLGAPNSYLAGRFTPTVSSALQKGACWGEFYSGGVWVLALAQL